MTLDDIQAFFKLEKQEWSDGKKVILAMPEIDSPEGAAMLSKIYDFSKEESQKFWLERVFRGMVPSPPETKSGTSLKEFLKSYPNAVGILQGSQVDDSVNKAVKLDPSPRFLLLLLLLGNPKAVAGPASVYEAPLAWRDDTGAPVSLKAWSGHRAVITLGYTACRRVCPMAMGRLPGVRPTLEGTGRGGGVRHGHARP